jgi:hypothetical protein
MFLQGLSGSLPKTGKKKSNKKRLQGKLGNADRLTIDQQITIFAEIIVNQLLKEKNLYEK